MSDDIAALDAFPVQGEDEIAQMGETNDDGLPPPPPENGAVGNDEEHDEVEAFEETDVPDPPVGGTDSKRPAAVKIKPAASPKRPTAVAVPAAKKARKTNRRSRDASNLMPPGLHPMGFMPYGYFIPPPAGFFPPPGNNMPTAFGGPFLHPMMHPAPHTAKPSNDADEDGQSDAPDSDTAHDAPAPAARATSSRSSQQGSGFGPYSGPGMYFPPPYMMAQQQMMLLQQQQQHYASLNGPSSGLGRYPPHTHQAGTGIVKSLALMCDVEHLSDYQILVRQQLELFEADANDVECNTQGRKKPVTVHQVGLRCRHCALTPYRHRGRGAVYYPAKLEGVYQAAQNMAGSHLCKPGVCPHLPLLQQQQLQELRARRDNASGGKQYWADGCRALGLIETSTQGLRFASSMGSSHRTDGTSSHEKPPVEEDAMPQTDTAPTNVESFEGEPDASWVV